MRSAALLAGLVTIGACGMAPAAAATLPSELRIAFVPLDDRPATEDFPQRIAAICGARLELPPQSTLGHFTQPGDPAAIGRWLLGLDAGGLTAVVVSTDMLAYGGLVASRAPDTSLGAALYRLRALADFHRLHPDVPIYAFGTVMRLAPTATKESEPYLEALSHYAALAGVALPTPEQSAALAISRHDIPDDVYWQYIGTRARDLALDEQLLVMDAEGDFAALALTQDDAGSDTGLHVPEEARLRALAVQLGVTRTAFFNPGADEMGMVMSVRAIEDAVRWAPSVDIVYPSTAAAQARDPLEYVPIDQTIGDLAGFMRMADQTDAGFALAVIAPDPAVQTATFFDADIVAPLRANKPVAIADLSFLTGDAAAQAYAVTTLGADGVAGDPIAYASWNTTANTAGTALATAAATLVGRRFGTFDAGAAATFLFERYVDDYGYRLEVRPQLQASLVAQGADVYALGDDTAVAESALRAQLWPLAVSIFDEDFKPAGWRDSGIGLSLPWQRTFETSVDASLERVVPEPTPAPSGA